VITLIGGYSQFDLAGRVGMTCAFLARWCLFNCDRAPSEVADPWAETVF
jgi:hypothetical protein